MNAVSPFYKNDISVFRLDLVHKLNKNKMMQSRTLCNGHKIKGLRLWSVGVRKSQNSAMDGAEPEE